MAQRNYEHHPIVRRKMHFDILNRLGVDYQCDGQTDSQTDGKETLGNSVV